MVVSAGKRGEVYGERFRFEKDAFTRWSIED